MSNPYACVHGPTAPLAVIARARAYIEWGFPVIHGSDIGTAATGVVSVASSQTIPFPRKSGLIESTSSYRFAPGTGLHANAGVREKISPGVSSARKRNARKLAGARSAGLDSCAALAGVANASTVRRAAARRAIPCVVGSF